MLVRSMVQLLETALSASPVVLLKGARQVGKSTLAMQYSEEYRVMDDVAVRINAKASPQLFIDMLPKPVCIDEIQKAPELLEAIKLYVDRQRRNGDFLITGSANLLDMKQTKDTLAGRIIELSLYPLSLKEMNGKPTDNIIDRLFQRQFDHVRIDNETMLGLMVQGGYPELLRIRDAKARKLWFASYISSYVERDARDMGELRELDSYFRFLNLIAPRSATLLNKSDLAKEVGVRIETLDNYLTILQQTFQMHSIRPYFENIGKQFVKSAKSFIADTGVLCYFLDIQSAEALAASRYKGNVVETFVLNELIKHLQWAESSCQLYHYRTHEKQEIDFVLVTPDQTIAVEVKSSSQVQMSDFKHILQFQAVHKNPALGVVFYMGDQVLWFDERCVAVPLTFFG
jgi:uncharacterized protein